MGAINISTLQIQPYSSRGPTEDGRQKPDLVAPDNVITYSYISDGFAGTSAAAPFIGGMRGPDPGALQGRSDVDVRRVLLEAPQTWDRRVPMRSTAAAW